MNSNGTTRPPFFIFENKSAINRTRRTFVILTLLESCSWPLFSNSTVMVRGFQHHFYYRQVSLPSDHQKTKQKPGVSPARVGINGAESIDFEGSHVMQLSSQGSYIGICSQCLEVSSIKHSFAQTFSSVSKALLYIPRFLLYMYLPLAQQR